VNCIFDRDVAGIFTNWQHGKSETDVPRPHQTVWLFEGRGLQPWGWDGSNSWGKQANVNTVTAWGIWNAVRPHLGGMNRLYLDGHVNWSKLILPRDFNNSRFEDGAVVDPATGSRYPDWTGYGNSAWNPLASRAGDATPYN